MPQGNYLNDAWGVSDDNVWAVGQGGTILKWDGTTFVRQESPTTRELTSIWGLDANNIWAVGGPGWSTGRSTLLKWDGKSWTLQTDSALGTFLLGIFGLDANNIWAVGDIDRIVKWDGLAWTPQKLGSSNSFNAVWASDPSNVWVVGYDGEIRKWDGKVWTRQPIDTHDKLVRVWGTDVNNVWTLGGLGTVGRWDGTAWKVQPAGVPYPSEAYGRWSVQGTRLRKWDGAMWADLNHSQDYSYTLNGVWGSDANHLWTVGTNGTILKRETSGWVAQDSGTATNLYGIWGSNANNVWAVGAGVILKWDGSSWTPQLTGITDSQSPWRGVWGFDANNVWVAGGNYVYKWNGSDWTKQAIEFTPYTGIWGSDPDNIWVVGGYVTLGHWPSPGGSIGTINKWDGKTWTEVFRAADCGTIVSIWGTDANNIWAVAKRCILRWNGVSWNQWDAPTPAQGYYLGTRIFGQDANHIWIVGQEGLVLRWNGAEWTRQQTDVGQSLSGGCVLPSGEVFAVGDHGAIIQGR